MSAEICKNMKNTLKIDTNMENNIFLLTDVNGEEEVIYTFQIYLFILKCFQFKNKTLKILNSNLNYEEDKSNLHVP